MSERAFTLDTRETVDEERAGNYFLTKARERFDALESRSTEWRKPEEGSVAHKIDGLTPYNPLSYQIGQLNMVTWDNIRSVFAYIDTVREIPPVALYSMIRSAVEATSQGLFILNAGRHEKMAFLTLRFTYNNSESLQSLGKVLAPSENHDNAKTKKRLTSLRDDLKGYSHKDLSERVDFTTLVTEADHKTRNRTYFTGLQVWKACSGVAHGNEAVIGALLEAVPTGESDSRGLTMMMTSRITFIAGFLMAAVENLEAMIQKYEELCQAPRHRTPA